MLLLIPLGWLVLSAPARADPPLPNPGDRFVCVAENRDQQRFEARSNDMRGAMGTAMADCEALGVPGCRLVHCGPARYLR